MSSSNGNEPDAHGAQDHCESDNSAATERWLACYQAGDRSALDKLLESHRPFLRRLVGLRMDPSIQRRVDSSDVVQEAQLEVSRRIDDYLRRRPCSFRVWLRATACQRLAMLWRFHRKAERRSVEREFALPDRSSCILAQRLMSPSPSSQMRRDELADIVRQAVTRLPEADREVLLMRNFEELTNKEVAEALEIDPVTASKRYGRALLRLREELHRGKWKMPDD